MNIKQLRDLAQATVDRTSMPWYTPDVLNVYWTDAQYISACDPEVILRLCNLADLGQAWEDVKKAVPDGWGWGVEATGPGYRATAFCYGHETITAWSEAEDTPTPAAALRALAQKLREP